MCASGSVQVSFCSWQKTVSQSWAWPYVTYEKDLAAHLPSEAARMDARVPEHMEGAPGSMRIIVWLLRTAGLLLCCLPVCLALGWRKFVACFAFQLLL